MEQHPVPQHIASFEFKLFGNLTAKQFITLSIPLSLAAIVFFSKIAPIIRIPFALILGLFGVFIALVPLGGRSFEKWVFLFIRAIFAPTQRLWIKETQIPEYLQIVVRPPASEIKIPEEITAKKRERLVAYLKSLPKANENTLDLREKIAIERLGLPQISLSESGGGGLPPSIIWTTSPLEEQLSRISSGQVSESLPQIHAMEVSGFEKRREEISKFEEEQFAQAINAQPKIAEHAKPYLLPGIEKRLSKKTTEVVELVGGQPGAKFASETNYSTDNIIPVNTGTSKVKLVHGVGKTRVRKLHFAPPENFDLTKLPVRGERKFDISEELKKRFHFEGLAPEVMLPNYQPKTQAVPKPREIKIREPQVSPRGTKDYDRVKDAPKLEVQEEKIDEKKKDDFSRVAITDNKTAGEQFPQAVSASIIPLTSTPNVISGLVTDKNGIPVSGAVVVVRDSNGIPVRALKTSKLGQFLSATPLSDGSYSVEVESDYVKFNPLSINLSGSVMPPYSIKGES